MTNIAIEFLRPMPPAERQTVELAMTQGLTSDKAAARALGLSPRAIGARWSRIAWRVQAEYGAHRDQVIIRLLADGWISVRQIAAVLMLALSACIGAGAPTDDLIRIRPGRTARTTTRAGRRELDDPLDMTELVLTDWRANA